MTDRLDAAALTRIATNYLARYAAPTARVRQVLERRVRRWHASRDLPVPDEAARMIDEVLTRLTQLALVDDGAFALGKARSLVRKGLPERRIRTALGAAGLDSRVPEIDALLRQDEAAQARRYAARKRLGPFRARERDAFRDKDVRSLLRAGFSFRVAAATVDGEQEADEPPV